MKNKKAPEPDGPLAKLETLQLDTLASTVPTSITNADSYQVALTYLTNVVTQLRKVEDWKEFFVKPLKQHVKNTEALFRPTLAKLTTLRQQTDTLIVQWREEERERAQKEQERLDAIRRKAEEKRAKAGKPPTPQVLTPIAVVAQPARTEHTTSGTIRTEIDWTVEVVDIAQVPDAYLRPRELALGLVKLECKNAYAAAGPTPVIPGLKITQTERTVVMT